ncbi:alpha/beta fold hydrolase [Mesorhizobium sp. 1B3]|uniref:alpha/beta fold hydrolase n=1 Tax=Mesorhizobium sp. 1B3 TaxID=3243599 RepID=UPI003D956128
MPYAQVGESRIYYEVRGDGPAVICPGGWSILTGAGHDRLPPQLREGFTTIVYDHRGLGRSTDDSSSISTVTLADDASAVIRHAGFGRVHVFGHGGLGACLSQHLAARHKDLVKGIVLVAGWAGPDTYKQAQFAMAQFAFEHGGFEAYQRYGALLIHTPEYFNDHSDEILSAKGSWGEFKSADLSALRRIQRATNEHDARDILPRIEAPCLVVHGELDVVDPPRLGEELARLIPFARLEIIPGTPHAMRTSPEGYKKLGSLVSTFFRQLEYWQAQAVSWQGAPE